MSQQVPKNVKDPKASPTMRRNSWISNLSSKFSSSTTSPQNVNAQSTTVQTSPKPANDPQNLPEQTNGSHSLPTSTVQEAKSSTPLNTDTGPSPRSPGFLQSALRRLASSTSSNAPPPQIRGSGGYCPRKVMNVDPHRERCNVPDLQPAKLRRVSFCVDVEIAGYATYVPDDGETEQRAPPQPPAPLHLRKSSLTISEKQVMKMRKREKKLKEKGEGEALKTPQAMVNEKEIIEKVAASGEKVALETSFPENDLENGNTEFTKKKEKKKRSEEERKQRKERKRQEALSNGSVPAEITIDESCSSSAESGLRKDSSPKARTKPTTDPLRIYKRCCQLRETEPLKKIVDQISLPSACLTTAPGIVSSLDLSGSLIEFQVLITLGDYLAVVPIKKLVFEDCGLTDEAIRIILAGILAVKSPEQAKHNRHLAKKCSALGKEYTEQLGVVERLSIKNNPKIGLDGWRHISTFLYMSHSLKTIDLSMIPLPHSPTLEKSPNDDEKSLKNTKFTTDISTLLQKALASRLAGSRLEEFVMAECDLKTVEVENIINGATHCGIRRIGLASNKLTSEGLGVVARYLQTGTCEGLNLAGNDLNDNLGVIAAVLNEQNALVALSLADCNLASSSLKALFPALVRLPNFRFIDLSRNRKLFVSQPTALEPLREYLPKFSMLRRLHLEDVSMSSDHAIALAEILPEIPSLAHINILENPQLSALASAVDEAGTEEACALYASLMAAVRVSETIICVDVDVPSEDSSEIVKALAKQVVAYSLRNMERGPEAEAYKTAVASIADPHGSEKHISIPDVLLHLVGPIDDSPDEQEHDTAAPGEDYIVGGTGVVKALGICLGNEDARNRRLSRDHVGGSGTATPQQVLQEKEVAKGKAKEMSKSLLGNARNIRERLQPALVREARAGNYMACSKCPQLFVKMPLMIRPERLQFLDGTLKRTIQRFEDEYPECRIDPPPTASTVLFADQDGRLHGIPVTLPTLDPPEDVIGADEEEDEKTVRIPVLRHNSEVSLASRHLDQEEGTMHRFGQQLRRDLFPPQTLDYAHGTTGHEEEAQHLKAIREKLEHLDGDDIAEQVRRQGPEALLQAIGTTVEELKSWESRDPKEWERFQEVQLDKMANLVSRPERKEADAV